MESRLKNLTWLDVRLIVRAFNWPVGLALAFCALSASLVFGLQPILQERLSELTAMRAAGQTESSRASVPPETRYEAFRNRLIAPEKKEDAIKQIFSVARDSEITLNQAEYQLTAERSGRYSRLQITLPIKGPYRRIRGFVDNLLVSHPALSLDEINFRRDSIKSQTVDAQLRLSLYLGASE